MISVETPKCPHCGKTSIVKVTVKQHMELTDPKSGRFITEIMSNWKPEERELLITGTHPKCFDEMYNITINEVTAI